MDRVDFMLGLISTAPTKRHLAYPYAALMGGPWADSINWGTVNRAIIERFSKSALIEIKEWAHGIAESDRAARSIFDGFVTVKAD